MLKLKSHTNQLLKLERRTNLLKLKDRTLPNTDPRCLIIIQLKLKKTYSTPIKKTQMYLTHNIKLLSTQHEANKDSFKFNFKHSQKIIIDNNRKGSKSYSLKSYPTKATGTQYPTFSISDNQDQQRYKKGSFTNPNLSRSKLSSKKFVFKNKFSFVNKMS